MLQPRRRVAEGNTSLWAYRRRAHYMCAFPFPREQIKDLKEGVSYVFRVRAQNKAGVGKASQITEPVLAETRPGAPTLPTSADKLRSPPVQSQRGAQQRNFLSAGCVRLAD